MPAIDLSRLKLQAGALAENFGQPQVFLRQLLELLDFYTNRTRRASQVARRLSLPTFHTPTPVLRQVERELVPLADARPEAAAALVPVLWGAATLETRLLAARLLGMVPPEAAMPLLTRLPGWLAESADKEVRREILTFALARVRRDNPQAFFLLLEDWLESPRPALQIWGLQALLPLLGDAGFQNLPAVLRILTPAFTAASPATQIELQACLEALDRRSRTETLAFLRDLVAGEPGPLFLRTLRRILPGLSPDLQAGVRELLREKGR